jgi:plastocyanin
MVMLWLLAVGSPSIADTTTVSVHDREGKPVPDVAVYVERSAEPEAHAAPGTRAVMDQVDQRFVPHLLVVQTGTLVEFPNSDTIAHHVYSFSHPNHFKLPIYKGNAHAPVRFEDSGIVVLGCNIHDNMLAYIAVVDTPVFGKTGVDGAAHLDGEIRAGDRISIWSPRLRDDIAKLSVRVANEDVGSNFAFRLQKTLRPPHHDETEALSWSEY